MIPDERGRVPFAMIGVLLLVGSATVASTMGPGAPTNDPATESALDRATATVNSELRAAADTAASDAASAPVVDPANTSWGDVLDEDTPFRDALGVRVYVETRTRLGELERKRGDVRVTASLPATPNVSALEMALDRVSIERADDNGTAMTATVRNVTLTVWRGDRVVTTRTISPRVTVATPVLEMHDRVGEYERRLNAGIATPGLTQRLTAQISAVAWARGWAQNRGAPIDNVVANRHVELATNAAALDVQRTTIGHVDREGLRRLGGSGLAVAGQDVLAATDASPPVENVTDDVATEIRRPGNGPIEAFDPPGRSRADDEMVVGVNRTADDRYLEYLDDGLEETIESVYTGRTRVETVVWDRQGGEPAPPGSPGSGWERVGDRQRTSTHVSAASGSPPSGGEGWERIDGFVRDVRLEHTRERVWERDNETRTTTSSVTERATVGIALLRTYDTDEGFWDGPVDGLYERGAGPLSGPNLAGIDDRARERLLDRRGGPDAIATRAVRGTVDESPVDVTGERPDGLRTWILTDVNGVRERLRNETMTAERDDVASFAVNPPGELADGLEDDRRSIVDPPTRFEGVADRARVAARAAYRDRVHTALETRAERHSERAGDVDGHLGPGGSIDALQRHASTGVATRQGRLPRLAGSDGPVRLRVDAAPSYLARAEIDADHVPATNGTEHALVARNVNVFTVPHGDVDDAIGNQSFEVGDVTRFDTAARALRAANETIAREVNETLTNRRDALKETVAVASQNVEGRLVETIVTEGIAGEPEAEAIVHGGLSSWNTTHGRVLAMANGSAAGPIAEEAMQRTDLPEHEADRLRLEIDRTLREAVESPNGRPLAIPVDDAVSATQEVTSDVFDRAIEKLNGSAIATNRDFVHQPAGLPIAPVPGSWYATTNVWTVTVRGEYARFGVRTTRAGPTEPGSEVAYVRDGANVTLDVTSDGNGETFGRATRVRFEAHAATAVLVPPGPQGVGDVDGDRTETSVGWPAAGPK